MTKGAIYEGTWTPWADVSCLHCMPVEKLKDFQGDVELMKRPIQEQMTDDQICSETTRCGSCEREIWIRNRSDVAQLHNLHLMLERSTVMSHMQQTGGMCVALLVFRDEFAVDGPHLMLFADDESNALLAAVCRDMDDEDPKDLNQRRFYRMGEVLSFIREWRILHEKGCNQ